MNYEIRITGGGPDNEIAKTLRCIAMELERGNHVDSLHQFNKCEWEYPVLMAFISEEDEDSAAT